MATNPTISKEKISMSYKKGTLELEVPALAKAIKEKAISGYIKRDGLLENGDSFAEVYLIIKKS